MRNAACEAFGRALWSWKEAARVQMGGFPIGPGAVTCVMGFAVRKSSSFEVGEGHDHDQHHERSAALILSELLKRHV